MAGVIMDRMSPESKISIFLGLPSMPKLNNESISVSDSEIGLNEGNSHDVADSIVFFINETTLGQSPKVGTHRSQL
jgi:hypothetical protein